MADPPPIPAEVSELVAAIQRGDYVVCNIHHPTHVGPDMDCGRPLPCPDHPLPPEPEAVIDPGEGLLT